METHITLVGGVVRAALSAALGAALRACVMGGDRNLKVIPNSDNSANTYVSANSQVVSTVSAAKSTESFIRPYV